MRDGRILWEMEPPYFPGRCMLKLPIIGSTGNLSTELRLMPKGEKAFGCRLTARIISRFDLLRSKVGDRTGLEALPTISFMFCPNPTTCFSRTVSCTGQVVRISWPAIWMTRPLKTASFPAIGVNLFVLTEYRGWHRYHQLPENPRQVTSPKQIESCLILLPAGHLPAVA